MPRLRLYILQCLSIVALLCGYLLTAQPGASFDMQFNANPLTAHYKITKTIRTYYRIPAQSAQNNNTLLSATDKPGHKLNMGKHIPVEVILPTPVVNMTAGVHNYITYTAHIPNHYNHQYCTEINPPPPKLC